MNIVDPLKLKETYGQNSDVCLSISEKGVPYRLVFIVKGVDIHRIIPDIQSLKP
jgi:hypothetical protein